MLFNFTMTGDSPSIGIFPKRKDKNSNRSVFLVIGLSNIINHTTFQSCQNKFP